MEKNWWGHPGVDRSTAAGEIDFRWHWADSFIEMNGREISASRLAVVTEDRAVQGAMLMTVDGVQMKLPSETGNDGLFIDQLFAAPWNRPEVLRDRNLSTFRDTGTHLIRAVSRISRDIGYGGRLKLEFSRRASSWYENRGFASHSELPIDYHGFKYLPMEPTANAADELEKVIWG